MTNKPTMAPVQPNASSQPNTASPVNAATTATIVPPAAGDVKLAAAAPAMATKAEPSPVATADHAKPAEHVAAPAEAAKPKI